MQGEEIHLNVKFSVANPYRICIKIFFFKMKLHIKHRQPSISGFFFIIWFGGGGQLAIFVTLFILN